MSVWTCPKHGTIAPQACCPAASRVSNAEGMTITEQPELSEWKCYLFGSYKKRNPVVTERYTGGMVYTPCVGFVPNWFVRYMMKICLGCTWVKGKEQ
tara:strand:+ start:2000 stop:2290 length:291 start_codon:yes stop_codon:yes gene_type:complete